MMARIVAIVGAGPAGFYAAEALLANDAIRVDMFDRLPTPFGLVRAGIAPDHPRTKQVARAFERTGCNPKFRYFGNIHVGEDISVADLKLHYDAVLLSHGAAADRKLAIDGENLPGCHSATEIVGWYNGHPDYADLAVDLSVSDAVIIGNGNVAADICRILLTNPDHLASTDIAAHALRSLRMSRVRSVHIVGRRGPEDCKFTSPELKELGSIAEVRPMVSRPDSLKNTSAMTEVQRRNLSLLRSFAQQDRSAKRSVIFHFNLRPRQVVGSGVVAGIQFENVVSGEAEAIECGMLVKSVGNHGTPIDGLPFDGTRLIIRNENGRVCDDSGILAGYYVAGWAKRGASGTVGTNRTDSQETCRALIADLPQLPFRSREPAELLQRVRRDGVKISSYNDWLRIDSAEIAAGQSSKPREKFVRVDDMLECARDRDNIRLDARFLV
jgi:ferredoxin/flavodoxin---NADP+ reductase